MIPMRLPPNQPLHFYRGGQAIADLRGVPRPADNRPEDWLGSVTTRFGSAADGLTILADGRQLREAVSSDPEAWLGHQHANRLGSDTYLLVKLLDAGERLPVHVHPDRGFAGQHLGLHHGKTESWVVLAAEGAEAAVYLGFTSDVDGADLRRWVSQQDTSALLGSLHRLDVVAGDSVLVPAGTPHAIGAGMFCIELQEPTDLSIMLETQGFERAGSDGHLGLGYDLALECVRRSALTQSQLEELWLRETARAYGPVQSLFGVLADPFFRAQRIRPQRPVTVAPSFAVTVTLAGEGLFTTESGAELATRRGDAVLFPYSSGAVTVSGEVDVVRCLPPLADAVDRKAAS